MSAAKRNGRVTLGSLASVPRLALRREDAAESLGMSLDHFERYVQPHVRLIRSGPQKLLVPVAELERWIDCHAYAPTESERGRR